MPCVVRERAGRMTAAAAPAGDERTARPRQVVDGMQHHKTRESRMRLFIAIATAVTLLAGAAPALAQAPERSVTAVATANVPVAKNVAKNSPAIRAAVEAAREKAGPAAIALAKEEAQRLAAAAGLTLGPLTSVAEQPASPFGPFSNYGADGTFGPGKFCGKIRTPIFRRDKHGRRVFTHRFRTHFGCRIPPQVSTTVSVTFAAS